jgi:phosphotransferase system enzyme I (PtsI)
VKKDFILRGEGIVDGILYENAFVYPPEKIIVPQKSLGADEVAGEIERYKNCLKNVKRRLNKDRLRVKNELGRQEADIFQSHIMITEDPFFTSEVPLLIQEKKRNSEWIIFEGLTTYTDTFNSIDDVYFRERLRDIEDVSMRIIHALQEKKETDILKMAEGILVVKELIPSMITQINTRKVKGIIAELGGETSHATILTKSLGIPFILNARDATEKIATGDPVIMDGHIGEIIVHPSHGAVELYKKTVQEYQQNLRILQKTVKLPSQTKDGTKITVSANIERVSGARIAMNYGAEGIGLFRTELPFILHNRLLSEAEQFEMYRAVLKVLKGKPATIRTLDIGGDKFFPFQRSVPFMEENPFLGLRSIRLSLLKPDIFRIQIRALLRASVFGKIRILLPMLSCYEEIERIQTIIEEEKDLLARADIEYDENIEVGAMIEIPSVALTSGYLIHACDFFSIGTNDLIQYTLAVDRTNERVSSYYVPENPAVLELIRIAAQSAVKNKKTCSVCGELAGSSLFTAFFIGVGIRELSMEPKLIPQVKKFIRTITIEEAERVALNVLKLHRTEEIQSYLRQFYNAHN